jgi:hypothetical protein
LLNPIIYAKAICARNSYLKEIDSGRRRVKRQRLLDIVGDRYDFYMDENCPKDAKRILDMGTRKNGISGGERRRLDSIRRMILEHYALHEGVMP